MTDEFRQAKIHARQMLEHAMALDLLLDANPDGDFSEGLAKFDAAHQAAWKIVSDPIDPVSFRKLSLESRLDRYKSLSARWNKNPEGRRVGAATTMAESLAQALRIIGMSDTVVTLNRSR